MVLFHQEILSQSLREEQLNSAGTVSDRFVDRRRTVRTPTPKIVERTGGVSVLTRVPE